MGRAREEQTPRRQRRRPRRGKASRRPSCREAAYLNLPLPATFRPARRGLEPDRRHRQVVSREADLTCEAVFLDYRETAWHEVPRKLPHRSTSMFTIQSPTSPQGSWPGQQDRVGLPGPGSGNTMFEPDLTPRWNPVQSSKPRIWECRSHDRFVDRDLHGEFMCKVARTERS